MFGKRQPITVEYNAGSDENYVEKFSCMPQVQSWIADMMRCEHFTVIQIKMPETVQ